VVFQKSARHEIGSNLSCDELPQPLFFPGEGEFEILIDPDFAAVFQLRDYDKVVSRVL
jgi:hypothetical protein